MMRKRWYVEELGWRTRQARSFEHALELAEALPAGRSWRILMRVGAGDTVVVRRGVGRRAA